MFDLMSFFNNIFSGFSQAAGQTASQATGTTTVTPSQVQNLFQFDPDGGVEFVGKASSEPPAWAPWHPEFEHRTGEQIEVATKLQQKGYEIRYGTPVPDGSIFDAVRLPPVPVTNPATATGQTPGGAPLGSPGNRDNMRPGVGPPEDDRVPFGPGFEDNMRPGVGPPETAVAGYVKEGGRISGGAGVSPEGLQDVPSRTPEKRVVELPSGKKVELEGPSFEDRQKFNEAELFKPIDPEKPPLPEQRPYVDKGGGGAPELGPAQTDERTNIAKQSSGKPPVPDKIMRVPSTGKALIRNPDGTYSSENSVTVQDMDGKWINIPTIVGGRQLTVDQAMEAYFAGENSRLGDRHSTRTAAVVEARQRSAKLSQEIAKLNLPKPPEKPATLDDLREAPKRSLLPNPDGELDEVTGTPPVPEKHERQPPLLPTTPGPTPHEYPPLPEGLDEVERGVFGAYLKKRMAEKAGTGNWSDYRGKRDNAAVRHNNPGAQWPGPTARKYGMTGWQALNDGTGQGNKIATFPSVVHGGAATFALYDRSYTGRTVAQAIQKWSGGNNVGSYLAMFRRYGISPDTVITKDLLRSNPKFAITFAKAMSHHELGRVYPMSDAEWQAAHGMYLEKETGVASK